jgi:hypothetical protein
MRSFRYVVADVFTDTPLAGNQLAVFTDARDLDGWRGGVPSAESAGSSTARSTVRKHPALTPSIAHSAT